MKSIKKPIEGYEGYYSITKDGRIWSHKRKGSGYNPQGRWLKPSLDTSGYLQVVLCKNGKQKIHRAHRLVGKAFIDNPDNKPQINHKDGNKLNLSLDNLEWVTPQENHDHAWEIGLYDCRDQRGENHGRAKLIWKQVNEIRKNHMSKGIMKRKPWDKYGIGFKQYYRIISKKQWVESNET